MCSIFGLLNIHGDVKILRAKALKLSAKMRNRGPDWSGSWHNDHAILVHERLAIVDMEHGAQPLFNQEKTHVLAVNGEIYNHKELAKALQKESKDPSRIYSYQTGSDCEVILALYKAFKQHPETELKSWLSRLSGMYAFILYDIELDQYLIARDPMGIIPLYYGYDELGQLYVASEMKALVKDCKWVRPFPPGQYLLKQSGLTPFPMDESQLTVFYEPSWQQVDHQKPFLSDVSQLKSGLEQSVKAHLMSDVPYGLLLSGGLDSSLIASITQKFAAKRIEDEDSSPAWWPQLHSFAIGLEGSPDLMAAKKVANAIGTIHHNLTFTVQDGLDALREVIYHIETYDVTTIRASTPMYLMARKIKAMGIKMVLSGEGADEIFGGYLYFHKAPDAEQFHQETIRKLQRLHLYDCLRANKSMSAWGIEARVPFLDTQFLELAMNLDPQLKMCQGDKIEKHVLRQAFEGDLPHEILWRQKEQFSDGVGYGWIDSLKAHAQTEISDILLDNASFKFPYNTPRTKEAYYYRSIFEESFPSATAAETVPGGDSVACSTSEAIAWDASFKNNLDPSGRAVSKVHHESY